MICGGVYQNYCLVCDLRNRRYIVNPGEYIGQEYIYLVHPWDHVTSLQILRHTPLVGNSDCNTGVNMLLYFFPKDTVQEVAVLESVYVWCLCHASLFGKFPVLTWSAHVSPFSLKCVLVSVLFPSGIWGTPNVLLLTVGDQCSSCICYPSTCLLTCHQSYI